MTLPASGNPISISQINTEFALGNSLSAYQGVTWWTDAGGTGTFSAGAISMSEFHSKRKNAPVTLSLSQLQTSFFEYAPGSGGGNVDVTFNTNGTWQATNPDGAVLNQNSPYSSSGNWASPTTAGIGSSYWIRFTRTAVQNIGSGSATASSGWLSLASARALEVVHGGGNGSVIAAVYTVEISPDSAGATIAASCTGVGLQVFPGG